MAMIIDGIMGNTLPWGLVLIGVFIAVVLQLAGVPALPSRWGSTCRSRPRCRSSSAAWPGAWSTGSGETPREESDSSPAVLMSSGYIAGGTIAAILVTVAPDLLPGWPTA